MNDKRDCDTSALHNELRSQETRSEKQSGRLSDKKFKVAWVFQQRSKDPQAKCTRVISRDREGGEGRRRQERQE